MHTSLVKTALFVCMIGVLIFSVRPTAVKAQSTGKVGLNYSAGLIEGLSLQENIDLCYDQGIKVLMVSMGMMYDDTLGGKDTRNNVYAIEDFINSFSSQHPAFFSDFEIWIDVMPNYGFEATWWWNRYEEIMDRLDQYSSVTYYGIYPWEFYAFDGGNKNPDASLVEWAYDNMKTLAQNHGRNYYFWNEPAHGVTNRWNVLRMQSASVLGYGYEPYRRSWSSPGTYDIAVGRGMWNYDQGAHFDYFLTKNLLEAFDAGWEYVFIEVGNSDTYQMHGYGGARAVKERTKNEYYSPLDGRIFNSQLDLENHLKANHPFLTVEITSPSYGQTVTGDFTVEAEISNIGSQTSPAVSAILRLDARGFIDLASGDALVKMLGNIAPGTYKTIQWNINAFAGSNGDWTGFKVYVKDGLGQYDLHFNDILDAGYVSFGSSWGTRLSKDNLPKWREVRAFSDSTEVNIDVHVYARMHREHWKTDDYGIYTTPFTIDTAYLLFLYTDEDAISRNDWAEMGFPEYYAKGPYGIDIRMGNYTPPPPLPTANIKGTVLDSTTQTPISGASVSTDIYSTATNSMGQYSFNVSLGLYNLTFSKSGYETWTGQVDASTADVYTMDAQLTPSPLQTYTLTITASTGGTTDPAPGAHTYSQGSIATITAYPDSGYFLHHWELEGENVGVDNPYSLTVNSDHNLHVVFSTVPPTTYSLIINSTTGGTTSPSIGTHLYNEGSNTTVTAVPEEGYLFKNWELDGSDAGNANPYVLLMDENHTLRAVFSPKPRALVSVTVQIQDVSTQEAVINASVHITNYTWTSPIKYTDSMGWASFTGVENGTYLIIVSAEGYKTAIETASINADAVYGIKVSKSLPSPLQPSPAVVTSVPEFDLLFVTSLGTIALFAIKHKFNNGKQKVNKRLRQDHHR